MGFQEHAAGGAPRKAPPRPGTVVKLTPAEAEVVAQLARGLSNREIAETLQKSLGTVKNQISNVYRKLGVNNRVRLIMMFRS